MRPSPDPRLAGQLARAPHAARPRSRRPQSAVGGALVRTEILRSVPEFRRLLFGFALAQVGAQLSTVVVAYDVYRITHSDLDVGLVSLVQIVPAFLAGVFGGAFADGMDRRKLLISTELTLIACAVTLAIVSSDRRTALPCFYLLSAGIAATTSVDAPARTAWLMNLVGHGRLVEANALRQLLQRASVVIGPSLGGLLLSAWGSRAALWLSAGGYLAALLTVLRSAPSPPSHGASRPGLRSVLEGISYLRTRPAIGGCFVADLNAMVLGMPTALFPALGITVLHGGARTVGLLFAAPGLGAFAASLLSGWTTRVRRPGRAVCLAIVAWGICITGLGASRSLGPALIYLVVAGAADVVSVVFFSTIIQAETPDHLRGRISALQSAVLGNGPRLGGVESGAVAALGGTQLAILTGGLGCVVGVVAIARWFPQFRDYRYEAHTSPPG